MLNAQDTRPAKQGELPKAISLQKSVKDVPEWTDTAYQRKKKVTLAL